MLTSIISQESVKGGRQVAVPEVIMDRQVEQIADLLGPGGHHQLSLSPDCTKLALVRTDVNRFIILSNTGAGSWTPSSVRETTPSMGRLGDSTVKGARWRGARRRTGWRS